MVGTLTTTWRKRMKTTNQEDRDARILAFFIFLLVLCAAFA